jgi:hypothetical protein
MMNNKKKVQILLDMLWILAMLIILMEDKTFMDKVLKLDFGIGIELHKHKIMEPKNKSNQKLFPKLMLLLM